jgi:serine O-acetyltransferase
LTWFLGLGRQITPMEQKFITELFQAHLQAPLIPSPNAVCNWLNGLLGMLFPELAEQRFTSPREFEHHYQKLKLELLQILDTVDEKLQVKAQELESLFMDRLADVRNTLLKDAEAILKGDPAAMDLTEVIRTYPGFYAIAVYRLAHEFHLLGVPLIPRILTEYAHSKTGVDIHPAAQIGEHFCIDHGSGVVIGGTSVIGCHVKIYQGVTLGALSVKKEQAKSKRHPTIKDHVVIYSGATILGGDTVIGERSIIGGNVWITRSVNANSRIYYHGQLTQKEVLV